MGVPPATRSQGSSATSQKDKVDGGHPKFGFATETLRSRRETGVINMDTQDSQDEEIATG